MAPSAPGRGASKVQAKTSSDSSGPNVNDRLSSSISSGRSRKRQTIASEKDESGVARGWTVITSTRCPGRSGLGKA